jgi:Glycosyl transferase 4-like domain/Glycosyl transferases group 1
MYGPRATQVSRTARELAAIGWRPTVVCMAPRRGGPHWPDGVDMLPPAGVDLVRIPSPEEWFPVRVAWRLAPIVRDWPDSKWPWIKRATRAVTRIAASDEYAGLLTFGQPWSDHLVGLRAKRATGLPWLAHFSDPWTDSPYISGFDWQRRIWRRMEADVIREADAVVFVTSETADCVMKKYPPEWRGKVAVVPHGYDRRPASSSAERRAGPMRVVHTGRFYAGIRTPAAVLQAIAVLHARASLVGVLDVLFVGPHNQEFAALSAALGLASVVRFQGRVSQPEAQAAAADADVLLVVDAPSRGASMFLPSKLIDYLPFEKPILGVTPDPGATASLLRRLGCPVAPPDDAAAIASALDALIGHWRAGALRVPPSFHRVAGDYAIERTTAQLNGVLVRAFDR